MPTLHGTRRSRASRNIWLAEEAGLDLPLAVVWQARRVERPEAEGAPVNTRSPAFLRLNPMGSIPVLTDGDLVLTESLAINLYLARAHGGDLGPRDDREAGLMAQWTLFAATSVEGPALAIQGAYERGEDASELGQGEILRQAEALGRPFGAAEAHLALHPFLVGDRFTVADINLAECVRYAQAHQPLMAAHPALDAWLRRCQARPGFLRMWAAREAEPMRA
jgi:glutathione S-transferase